MHIEPRQVDVIWIQAPGRHDLLDLSNTDLPAGGGWRIEIAGSFAEDKTASRVCPPRLDNRQIRNDASLEYIDLAVAGLQFLALGNDRADGGLGVEASNACGRLLACAQRGSPAD